MPIGFSFSFNKFITEMKIVHREQQWVETIRLYRISIILGFPKSVLAMEFLCYGVSHKQTSTVIPKCLGYNSY